MGSPPGSGRSKRAHFLRAALPCLALTALGERAGGRPEPHARPVQSQPRRLCLARHAADAPHRRRAAGAVGCAAGAARSQRRSAQGASRRRRPRASVRSPTYGLPAANGASGSGYDSLNRKRQQPKLYPGQPKPKRPVGPGSPVPPATPDADARPAAHRAAALETANKAPVPRGDGRHRARPAAAPPPQGSTTIRSARSATMPAAS